MSDIQEVVKHYTKRHAQRGDLFGRQPFANYGYWESPDLTIEEAAEALTHHVARAAGIGPGDEVLDVGCGYGAGSVIFARDHQAARIIGIDVTDVRIEAGRQYVAEHGLSDRIDLRLGDATRMDFPDASFDKLVSVECAFHFVTRRDFLREAGRVLRPGGRLALTDMIPRRGSDPRAYQRGEITLNTGVCLDNLDNAYDADVYTGYLRESGFVDIAVDSIVERTRARFADALERLAERGGEGADAARRTAVKLRALIAAGEDYVLVTARKPD